VDKYTWVDVGSSFLPSDILAAVLLAQFERAERIQARRRQVCERYQHELQDWACAHHVRLPIVPAHCEQSWHMFYLLLPSLDVRQRLIAHLKQSGILAVFHYLPLHISDMGRKFGGKLGDCPVTEDVSDRLLRLPLYHDLSEGDQRCVLEAIKEFKAW
jgi:dTDP-4-amino-4,6-dideoxygalactose transaminase